MRPSRSVQQTSVQARRIAFTENPQTKSQPFAFATQGNQGSRRKCREGHSFFDHYKPEKIRMECVWKNLLRRYRVRLTAGNSLLLLRCLELAIGFEPTTL
jgi:hypothetical protein